MTNNKTIGNPKTEVPQTPQMSDRDFLNDMLSTEKYMTTSYSYALIEASHNNLYRDIAAIASETQNCQRQIFNLMFKKGWYSFEAEDEQTLNQSYQRFSGYNSQFPYA